MDYTQFIEKNLAAGADIALRMFGRVANTTKPTDNNQVLTEADLTIGSEIIAAIEKEYPSFNIVDEEAGVINKNSEYTWVIDPIDGTSNFASGSPLFGIFLGLLHNNHPIAGGIILPCLHELYWGQQGTGAFCNGKPIRVSTESRMLSSLVSYSLNGLQNDPDKTRKETELMYDIVLHIRNLRATGSAFDPACVARGVYGAYMHMGTSLWDVVASHAVIESAGGVFTDFFGNDFDYSDHLVNHTKKYPLCAGSPLIHSQLQVLIHKHY